MIILLFLAVIVLIFRVNNNLFCNLLNAFINFPCCMRTLCFLWLVLFIHSLEPLKAHLLLWQYIMSTQIINMLHLCLLHSFFRVFMLSASFKVVNRFTSLFNNKALLILFRKHNLWLEIVVICRMLG